MLELRSYMTKELREILRTNSIEGIRRKLKNYGISYNSTGRGDARVFEITAIENQFKIFAIIELGFGGGTDFTKLLYFYYYFFNDMEFMAMPYEVQQVRMAMCGHQVSRQTIKNYVKKLDYSGFINQETPDYIYYFAHKHQQHMTDAKTYKEAWGEYWKNIERGEHSAVAIYKMKCKYGGVARRHSKPYLNAFYANQLAQLQEYIIQELDKITESSLS